MDGLSQQGLEIPSGSPTWAEGAQTLVSSSGAPQAQHPWAVPKAGDGQDLSQSL